MSVLPPRLGRVERARAGARRGARAKSAAGTRGRCGHQVQRFDEKTRFWRDETLGDRSRARDGDSEQTLMEIRPSSAAAGVAALAVASVVGQQAF